MRPASIAEVLGQEHLLGSGKLLSRVGAGELLPSLILWGPPGSGKTTLARLLVGAAGADFAPLSAVMAGVKDVREIVIRARDRRDQFSRMTVLFLDEIHRFSKAQQDALLPHVESGIVTLIGATTENPSFHVNSALLSRCRVLRLEALAPESLRELVRRALADSERGLGTLGASISDDALNALVAAAEGDARRLLGSLEVAAAIVGHGEDSARVIDAAAVGEALQEKTFIYDKSGEEHYGVVSALIKSLRGSDPDAGCYWMARMLESGEDPLFVLRRLVIFASEDIGNADPQALILASATLEAFRFLGLPEGVLPLTQLVLYLAAAPKSNSALATYAAARAAVRDRGSLPVPPRLRNASTTLQTSLGYGVGYRNPHAEEEAEAETYLPDELAGAVFYRPARRGYENLIARRLEELRSAGATDGREPTSGAAHPGRAPRPEKN